MLKHILGNLPVIRVLDFLIDNPGRDYTKTEIAIGAEVGPTDMKRDFSGLIKCGVVIGTRKIGVVWLYELNMANEMAQSLIAFDVALAEYCAGKIIKDGPDRTAEEQELYDRAGYIGNDG